MSEGGWGTEGTEPQAPLLGRREERSFRHSLGVSSERALARDPGLDARTPLCRKALNSLRAARPHVGIHVPTSVRWKAQGAGRLTPFPGEAAPGTPLPGDVVSALTLSERWGCCPAR